VKVAAHVTHLTDESLTSHQQSFPTTTPALASSASSALCHFNLNDRVAYCTSTLRGGAMDKAFGLAISRSRVQILLEATLRNNLRQVVYTYMPLSPSSITWYRPKGGDALRLVR